MGMLLRRHYQQTVVEVKPTAAAIDNTVTEEKTAEKPVVETAQEELNLTKTDINRMSKTDLVKLSTEQGFKNAEETSGAELKKKLIEKFGL